VVLVSHFKNIFVSIYFGICLIIAKLCCVGINLTAADTCIIFDSDWNPQNDLQAQARCHRIGQTKDVKVYRFLTKKTYEMRLFHLGSMKLGLDKAVLQGVENKRETSITEQEAERLLRFGAYDVLSEDKNSTNENDSKSFMEEDIDTILLRRTKTQIHDRQISNGFNFSKASFKPVNSDSLDGSLECDVDVDDPDFWTKIFAVADSKKGNLATPISNDEMIAYRDYQDNKGTCENSGIEEAETKKTRGSVPHEITRNDPVSFSTSPDDSDHTKPRAEPDRRTKKSKASSLQKSKSQSEGTSDQKGRRRKRRRTVDANSSPTKSKRSKPLSSSVMSSPPSSAPISIRRSPRLNPRKCDDVVWSPQSDMSYAVAAGITRRIGVSEKKSTMVKSIPSKVRPRGLPKRRLFSSRTKDNSQDIVGIQKNVEACQDKSPKTASQNAAMMQLTKPSRQIRGDGMVVGNTPFHTDSGTSTKMRCKQKEKLRDDDSSINGTKLSLPNTPTMPREKIDKHSTSARSSVSTTIASSQNKWVTTSNPNISKEPLPLKKGMVNTECPTSDMGKASSSADVKSKWYRNTSTMGPSRPNTSRSKSMSSYLQSTKQKVTTIQSADSIVQEAQEVNPKQLKREEDESVGMGLTHNTLKLKTQRGRKTRRPQYYVPPITNGKRKRTKIQRPADSNERSNQHIVPQNAMSMEHEFSRTKETNEQSHNMPPGTIVKLQSKKVESSTFNSRPQPLSKSDSKQQQHARSKKETKQQSVRRKYQTRSRSLQRKRTQL
jgi:Superfamily II DNA/RNA helicases, SNF2 family